MRGKRSKQYRKLMNQYELAFNFREPYQVLLDADIVRDTTRMKMDLEGGLKRTLHGLVKPMITTCSMRHLYASDEQEAITIAKAFERRRCNHHTLDEPLPEIECLQSVVDPKSNGTNKFRYAVASQSLQVRALMREILGVPLIYVKKSVMIMEPMAEKTGDERLREERSKFKLGLKMRTGARSVLGKHGREDEDDHGEEKENHTITGQVDAEVRKKKRKGPKQPNPLSMKKPKRRDPAPARAPQEQSKVGNEQPESNVSTTKRKRTRKPSSRPKDGVPVEAESLS